MIWLTLVSNKHTLVLPFNNTVIATREFSLAIGRRTLFSSSAQGSGSVTLLLLGGGAHSPAQGTSEVDARSKV